MDEKREAFLEALDEFYEKVQGLKQFKGKAKALRSLERLAKLKVFTED